MHEKTLTPGDMAGKGLVAPDRIKQIENEPGRMTNTAAVSFFTAYAYRLFRKNFYRLSLKIIAQEGGANSMDRLAAARQDFLAGIEALAKDYEAWHDLENTLAERQFSDIVEISPACTQLRQAFVGLDRFLIPPYLARTGGLITQTELVLITDDVDKLVKPWLASIDDKRIAVSEYP